MRAPSLVRLATVITACSDAAGAFLNVSCHSGAMYGSKGAALPLAALLVCYSPLARLWAFRQIRRHLTLGSLTTAIRPHAVSK